MKELATNLFWILVLTGAAGGYYAIASREDSIPAERQRQVETAKGDREPAELPAGLEPELIAAWKKECSVRVGWYAPDEWSGCWEFYAAKPTCPDALPALRVVGFPSGRIATLPAPSAPFALATRHAAETEGNLKELAALANLRLLDLSDSNAGDEAVKEIAGLRNLQCLYLNSTSVGDAGLKHLAGLERLQILGLVLTPVTDEGLKELAPLKSLRSLDLRSTSVTDAGKSLPGSRDCKS
jgi:hypothetical protein